MADMGKMCPNLMGSAGFQGCFNVGKGAQSFQNPIVGHGSPSPLRIGNALTKAIFRIPANWPVDGARIFLQVVIDDGVIDTGDGMIRQLPSQEVSFNKVAGSSFSPYSLSLRM